MGESKKSKSKADDIADKLAKLDKGREWEKSLKKGIKSDVGYIPVETPKMPFKKPLEDKKEVETVVETKKSKIVTATSKPKTESKNEDDDSDLRVTKTLSLAKGTIDKVIRITMSEYEVSGKMPSQSSIFELAVEDYYKKLERRGKV